MRAGRVHLVSVGGDGVFRHTVADAHALGTRSGVWEGASRLAAELGTPAGDEETVAGHEQAYAIAGRRG